MVPASVTWPAHAVAIRLAPDPSAPQVRFLTHAGVPTAIAYSLRSTLFRACGFTSVKVQRAMASAALALAVAACGNPAPPSWAAPATSTVAQMHGPWLSFPLVPNPEVLARADTACQQAAEDIGISSRTSLVLADARGEGVLSLAYAEGGLQLWCLGVRVDPDGSVEPGETYGGATHPAPPGARDLEVEATGSIALGSDRLGMGTFVTGLVGGGVAGVGIHTPRGDYVTASVGNGRFAAWWPGQAPGDAVLTALDGHGREIKLISERLP